jgi:hypothetical protein
MTFRRRHTGEDRLLWSTEAAQVACLWQYLQFWSLPGASDEVVCDGTRYVLEPAERGRYHIAHRDDPERGDTFGEFCELLVRPAGFSPR